MEAELKANLLAVARAFASSSRLALSTVAHRAAKDARFFDRLGDGKSFTAKTYDTIMQWFSDRWPEGLKWPAEVPRPDPQVATPAQPGEAA